MAMPAYIIAYTYTGIFDFAGPVQSALRIGFGWGNGDYWFPRVRSLGLRPGAVLWRVHLPIMRGSLLTALLLVFVDVLKELPATLVLRPFNFNTLAVRTFELASDEMLAESSLAALAIVLAGILPVILLSRSIRHVRQGGAHVA
jgi:iron(III) transport system permease protein